MKILSDLFPDHLAIHKLLRNNTPLTQFGYKDLEQILTSERGTAKDYQGEFKDTHFGLFVRKVAKLDYQATNNVFSEFINEQSLNQEQIVFVKKVIGSFREPIQNL